MKFEKLFKKPFATQDNLKKWEDSFFHILYENKEKYFPKNIEPAIALEGQDTLIEINDSERETWIVATINRAAVDLKLDERSQIFINNYDPKRPLDAFKIFESINSIFEVEESAPNLKQALDSQDLDLFFKYLTQYQYDLSMTNNSPSKRMWHIKNERDHK